jgi:D-alanyl-D-alanine carboxypeptidase
VFPDQTDYVVAPGEEFTFDVHLQYTDKDGKTAQGEIEDKSDLIMKFSDGTLCNRPAYNIIKIKDNAESGKNLKITLKYGDTQKEYHFMIAYSLAGTVDANGIVTNPNSTAVLVNKSRLLASSYSPSDLIKPNIKFSESARENQTYLCYDAATAAEKMFTAAKNSNIILVAVKGYAPYASSDPEHQTGFAMDVTNYTTTYYSAAKFAATAEGQWIIQNSYKYGFIIRYPSGKENVTGFAYNPSHLRYVGVDLATYLHDNNLTMEEFFAR